MTNNNPNFWLSVGRAIKGKCPNCGQGKLFKSYLKQLDACEVCDEEFGHLRAEDGPAWLTILIVGHIMSPFLFLMAIGNDWPDWVAMIVWPGLATILMLIILPRSKGAFLAVIWRTNCAGAEKDTTT